MLLHYLTGIACLFLYNAVDGNVTGCKPRNLTTTVDNNMRLYIDGVEMTNLTNVYRWEDADTVELPCNATVIAIEGRDKGAIGGILASTDDGYILTNSSWKCTNRNFTDWQSTGFDDSDWPPAFETLKHTTPPHKLVPGIRKDAFWIWTTAYKYEDQMVYCRKTLDANECVLGPPDNECDSSMGKCINFLGSYNCSCYEGYVNAGSKRCEDVDECAFGDSINKCGSATGNCVNLPGSYNCSCHQGYHTVDTQACEDIDECLLGPPENQCNACSGNCINTKGSYECHCYQGFTNVGDQRCEVSTGNDSTTLIILGVFFGVSVLVNIVLVSALLILQSRNKTIKDQGQSGRGTNIYQNDIALDDEQSVFRSSPGAGEAYEKLNSKILCRKQHDDYEQIEIK